VRIEAAGEGFEPSFRGPEPRVLPLDDPAICASRRIAIRRTETRERVRRLLEEGKTVAEIAATLGVSRPTVCYHKRRLGYPMDGQFARRFDWQAIQEFYDSGNSRRACQRKFGFSGCSWAAAVQRGDIKSRPKALPLNELLAGRRRNRSYIKRRLIAAGLKDNKCEQCGISEWESKPLSLALHHINGDGMDNRLENLAILCPNCHSQTPNFGVKNKGARPPLTVV
jgi:hypothetical protein